jgi:hypothetical protein
LGTLEKVEVSCEKRFTLSVDALNPPAWEAVLVVKSLDDDRTVHDEAVG